MRMIGGKNALLGVWDHPQTSVYELSEWRLGVLESGLCLMDLRMGWWLIRVDGWGRWGWLHIGLHTRMFKVMSINVGEKSWQRRKDKTRNFLEGMWGSEVVELSERDEKTHTAFHAVPATWRGRLLTQNAKVGNTNESKYHIHPFLMPSKGSRLFFKMNLELTVTDN